MKKVLASMSKFIFSAFAIAVLALLMSLTYGALQKLFPDSFANQAWGLVMFDIAAMCWAVAFVFQSKSTLQYAASGIGFLVAFLGTLGMVAAEVMLSGQNLAQVDTSQIGRWMVYGFIIVTALHAALIYIHHAGSPEISEQINVGVARGEVVSQAIKDATHTIEAEKQELSRAIYYDIVSQVKRDLGLHPVQGTPFEPKQLVLEPVSPPTQQQQTKPRSLWDAVKLGIQEAQQGLRGKPNTQPAEPEPGAPDNYGPLWKASTDIPPTFSDLPPTSKEEAPESERPFRGHSPSE